MRKLFLTTFLLLQAAFITTSFAASTLFEMALANKAESDAFVASLPTNFSSTGTISSQQWGGTYGVKIERNSSLNYTATGLTAGDYTIEGSIMIQNTANLAWVQDVWASGGTVSTPILQSGTNGSYVTYTVPVTVASNGDYTFGIVRNNTGGQLYVKEWKVTSSGGAASTETDVTTFTLPEQTGDATIDAGAHTVAIEVAYGTTVTALTPTIALSSGATVSPNTGVAQDFTSAVMYSVTAEDGTTMQDWTVTVAVAAASSEMDIATFTLPNKQTGNATIDAGAHTVAIEVVYGTNLTSLTPTLTLSTGATSSPNSGVVQDFSSPLTYSVTAEDGITMQDWTVTVTIAAASTENDITAFTLPEQTGDATIDAGAHTVAIEVENGTDASSLTPTITLSTGATISPLSGVAQNFSSPVTYTVTAQDGSSIQTWDVTVTEGAEEGEILFEMALANQTESEAFIASLPSNFSSTGTISSGQWGGTYGVKIERSSSLNYTATGLTAGDYTIEGSIMIQNTSNLAWIQDVWSSGGTVSTPILQSGTNGAYVTYSVPVTVASDGDYTFGIVRNNTGGQLYVKEWKVQKVVSGLSSENDIAQLFFNDFESYPAIDAENHEIFVAVNVGADVSSCTPIATLSANATISPAMGVLTDFSSPVNYTITAEDGSQQVWTITILKNVPTSLIQTDNNSIKTYPNPASNFVVINNISQGEEIKILNLSGQTVFSAIAKSNKERLNIADLKSGLYIIQSGFKSTKIIKN